MGISHKTIRVYIPILSLAYILMSVDGVLSPRALRPDHDTEQINPWTALII